MTAGRHFALQCGSTLARGHALLLRGWRVARIRDCYCLFLLRVTSFSLGYTDEMFQGWEKEILIPRPPLKRNYATIV